MAIRTIVQALLDKALSTSWPANNNGGGLSQGNTVGKGGSSRGRPTLSGPSSPDGHGGGSSLMGLCCARLNCSVCCIVYMH